MELTVRVIDAAKPMSKQYKLADEKGSVFL